MSGLKLILAGGGTGGHLFPALALAEALRARDPQSEVRFVGTARGLEAKVVPEEGYPLDLLEVTPLKGRGPIELARSLMRLPDAVWDASRIISSFRPDLVVGVGGYASGPMLMAARLFGRPTAILEQNSVPGLTNRVLGKLVDRVFTAFPQAESYFPSSKVRMLGNPLRKRLRDAAAAAEETPEAGRRQRLLIVGGSQGAHAINELGMLTVETLAHRGRKLKVLHQTGEADCAHVAQNYASSELDAEVVPFIRDPDAMARAYREADLVMGRAGALTLAEICAFGRPSVLIPLPSAADDHQRHNARALVEAGAAVMLEQESLDAVTLAEELRSLVDDPARLSRMGVAARGLARPRAAEAILDELVALARSGARSAHAPTTGGGHAP